MADQSKTVVKESQDLWPLPKYLKMVPGKKMSCVLPGVVTWRFCPRHNSPVG